MNHDITEKFPGLRRVGLGNTLQYTATHAAAATHTATVMHYNAHSDMPLKKCCGV